MSVWHVQLTLLLLLKHTIPVFVDHDNLLVEAQKLGAEYFDSDKDDRIHMKYRKLEDFIAGERTVKKYKVHIHWSPGAKMICSCTWKNIFHTWMD